jgi:protein subunit release factor A
MPSGIVVTSSEKSQHKNRARAMKALKARLYGGKRDAPDAQRSEARKSQVGSGDRSERIVLRGADSDDAAHSFRHDAAQHSGLMPPI